MATTKTDVTLNPPAVTDFGVAYFVGLRVPDQIAARLEATMQSVAGKVGDGLIVQPARSLHVTVLDCIDPFVDPKQYGYANKTELWQKIGATCQAAIKRALKAVTPFDIVLSQLVATDGAIILKGSDDGQLQQIRASIMADIAKLRLPGSKQPPTIIHCSLARYAKVMDLEPIMQAVAAEHVACTLHVDAVHLYRQTVMNLLEYNEVAVYDV